MLYLFYMVKFGFIFFILFKFGSLLFCPVVVACSAIIRLGISFIDT